ncbi:zinc finger protein 239-like [Wyeomyia smithii]|uniref:zinc finger protein 239-like n=1 Tax=Wyeomyia smithii TaxID=174621 RepID=UPI002467CC6F|nr:zinc finger protein 239-like [Wyeomyia smithii]
MRTEMGESVSIKIEEESRMIKVEELTICETPLNATRSALSITKNERSPFSAASSASLIWPCVVKGESEIDNTLDKVGKPTEMASVTDSEIVTSSSSQTNELEASPTDSNERKHNCDIDNKECKVKRVTYQRKKASNGEQSCKCDKCGKTFSSALKLRNHNAHHTLEKNFSCDICRKAFCLKSQLRDHMKKHMSDGPNKCLICGIPFRFKSYLARHAYLHTDERRHRCDICGKEFKSASNLTVHMKYHTSGGDELHKCGFCGKGFNYHSFLLKHMHTHSDKRRYTCDICGKDYKSPSNLNQHKRHHTSGDDVLHKCDICGRGFVLRYALVQHLETHSDERRYRCDICGKQYKSRGGLFMHGKAQHSEQS